MVWGINMGGRLDSLSAVPGAPGGVKAALGHRPGRQRLALPPPPPELWHPGGDEAQQAQRRRRLPIPTTFHQMALEM